MLFDVVRLCMRLCYGLCLLFVYRFHWFVLCVILCFLFWSVFAFGVYVLFVVCCAAVCCFIGLSCVYVVLLLGFRSVCCYGLNDFPVCECMLYAP